MSLGRTSFHILPKTPRARRSRVPASVLRLQGTISILEEPTSSGSIARFGGTMEDVQTQNMINVQTFTSNTVHSHYTQHNPVTTHSMPIGRRVVRTRGGPGLRLSQSDRLQQLLHLLRMLTEVIHQIIPHLRVMLMQVLAVPRKVRDREWSATLCLLYTSPSPRD